MGTKRLKSLVWLKMRDAVTSSQSKSDYILYRKKEKLKFIRHFVTFILSTTMRKKNPVTQEGTKPVWLFLIALYSLIRDGDTGSRSTFEFPSRVNLSGPSLYCIARTSGKYRRHSIGLAGSTRLTRSDFRLNLLLLIGQLGAWGVIIKNN